MRQMKIISTAVLLAVATPALANGCNGVVSQLEWGCAAWDNNNGPQFPHYNKTGAASAQPNNRNIMGNNGANILGNNGANILGNNGANIVGTNSSRIAGGNNGH